MAVLNLDYVHTFYDARGKLRHVFRRKGHKQKTIKGRPGSCDFMDAYHALLAQTGGAQNIGAISRAGSIDNLILRYLQSDAFTKGLGKATQPARRRILEQFREFETPSGRRYGDNRLWTMQTKDVAAVLEGKVPNAQIAWLKALRGLIAFGKVQGECKVNPTEGIKALKADKSKGHMTWKPPQIERYRAHHPLGTVARLAMELMLNVGARREDAYKLGHPHKSFDADHQLYKLTWRPSKTSRSTGKVLSIPILPTLQAALDAMPRSDALIFLLNEWGRPFASAAAFGGRFADWCRAAGLEPVQCDDGRVRNYRAHGLRKAALYTLYKAGGTVAELQALGGHASIAELQKYIEEVEQDEQAISGMAKVIAAQVKARTTSG